MHLDRHNCLETVIIRGRPREIERIAASPRAQIGFFLLFVIPGIPKRYASTLPFDVPSCPGSVDDQVAGTPQHCEAQPSEFAPAVSVPARSAGTDYHLFLQLDGTSIPATSQWSGAVTSTR